MGKKRRNMVFGKRDVGKGIGSAYEDKVLIDTQKPDYIYDEVEQYNNKRAKLNIERASNVLHKKTSKKEHVLTLDMGSSDEEEEDDDESESSLDDESDEDAPQQRPDRSIKPFLASDDIVAEKQDKEIDERAWGKDTKTFYGTNITDHISRKRATNQHRTEVHDAITLELEGHKSLQDRMKEKLKSLVYENYFDMDDDDKPDEPEKEEAQTSTLTITPEATDDLSVEEKLKMLGQLSPEFMHLTKDAIEKNEECVTIYEPILAARKKLGDCPGLDYVITKWRTCRNYSLHVLGYVLLLNTHGHTAIKTHPVMDTLAVYRFLFKRQEPLDRVMRPQMEALVQRLASGAPLKLCHPPDAEEGSTTNTKTVNKTTKEQLEESDTESDNDGGSVVAEVPLDHSNLVSDDARRHIGDEITKNKGLMPHRKRAIKNPRMKYKTKYADKVKRRKGQVREVRREVTIYRGEQSGINPYVVKSRKLK